MRGRGRRTGHEGVDGQEGIDVCEALCAREHGHHDEVDDGGDREEALPLASAGAGQPQLGSPQTYRGEEELGGPARATLLGQDGQRQAARDEGEQDLEGVGRSLASLDVGDVDPHRGGERRLARIL